LTNWQGKKVTILGLGKTGHATAMYMAGRGARLTVSEGSELKGANVGYAQDLERQEIMVESGGHSDEALQQAELIVTSPGIRPDSEVMQRAKRFGKEVISDVELAFRDSTVPMVAVTGTNGKSTTTALVSFLLMRAGRKAPACGNIGLPILTALQSEPDYLIVETSSFQLYYTIKFSPRIGVWLNLTPDHLDWHGNLDAYVEAKAKLFHRLGKDQFAVLNCQDKIVAATKTKATIVPFGVDVKPADGDTFAFMKGDVLSYRHLGIEHDLCRGSELQIIGRHNLENALAAVCVGAILGLQPLEIEAGLKEFKALEHRLEYVDTIEGVPLYNDSKATNTDSAIKALESFDKKIVLIAGGRDKGTDLSDFVHCVRKHAAAVILLGEAKERFAQAFREGGVKDIHSVGSLAEAVELGIKLKAGPIVLSPACASYDMFRDFEDRGNVFKDIVRSRREETAPSSC
jgi:UDP-N-acetylmuramoylalanine--D-glutamate ligase